MQPEETRVSIERGRVALVTGSTSGIGREVAWSLAEAGARVVITGRDEGRGSEVVEEITGAGGKAVFVAHDLEDADLTWLLKRAEGAFGRGGGYPGQQRWHPDGRAHRGGGRGDLRLGVPAERQERVSSDWGVGSRDGRAWLGSYHQRVERLRAARAVPPPWPGALRGDEGGTRAAHTGVGRRVRSPRRGGQLRRAGADALSVHGQESRPRRRGYSGAGGVYHPRRASGRARRRRGGGAVFGGRGGWLRPGGRAQRGRRAGHSLGARYLPRECGWLRRRRETPMVRGSRSRRAARASSSLSCVRPALIRPYLRSGPTLVAQWQACSGWRGATRWYWQASSCRWGRSRTALLGSLVAGEAFASGLHLAGYICAGAFLVGAV